MAKEQKPLKDRLIYSGATLFSEKGYAGVSVREICKHADTSISMIHHYFDNKAGLLKAIVDQFSSRTFALPMQLLGKESQSKDDLQSRIVMLFEATLDACISEREILLVIIREQSSHPLVIEYHKCFVSFIEKAKNKGHVRKELDSSMVSGFMMDRILNQVQFAPAIKKDFGTDLLGDPEYRRQWCAANLDLLLNGMLS
jgi:AcrR family transcriptional regulator